jgi:hypothetical protein
MPGHEPNQHPTPLASGGSRNVAIGRSLRGAIGTDVRQPDLKQPPAVSAATGFGTGAGALILNNGSDADQSQGLVAVKVGLTPAGTGTIALVFPGTIVANQYWIAADWCSQTSAVTTGHTLTITWTATRPLIPGEVLRMAYQWAVST